METTKRRRIAFADASDFPTHHHRHHHYRDHQHHQQQQHHRQQEEEGGQTSMIPVSFTNHGRQRQLERQIPLRDVQAAIKYGTATPHVNPNLMIYTHNGLKHIIERSTSRLITAMVSTIQLDFKTVTSRDMKQHKQAMERIHRKGSKEPGEIKPEEVLSSNMKSNQNNSDAVYPPIRSCWKSHSVLIVDRSGSMRNSDVAGCRTRLGAVWLSIAQDFINHRIESGIAGDQDVVTIILMGNHAKVLIDKWPTDAVLYNRIVQFFFDSEKADVKYARGEKCNPNWIRPYGHGCYGPALALAEKVIHDFDDSSSILQLLVLSDGKPSDSCILKVKNANDSIKEAVGNMASKYGRRFNFAAIGMGNMKDYDCLKDMTECAKEYGAHLSSFQVPAMSCAKIGAAMSSVATTLSLCQTKLNGNTNGGYKRVRSCFRESTKSIPALTEWVDNTEFHIYSIEKVERYEYRVLPDGSKAFQSVPLLHKEAQGVAIKRKAFGEGSERLAFQFFEISEDGSSVVGEPLVAKKSRFIDDDEILNDGNEEEGLWKDKDRFAKRFCKIQTKARECAEAFNRKLDSFPSLDPDTVRVSFIDCYVYYLNDRNHGESAVVVEPKLEGRFEKWNNNNGWMKESTPKKSRKSDTNSNHKMASIAEGNENVDHSDTDENSGKENEVIVLDDSDDDDGVIDLTGLDDYITVTKNEVAQAFSHFSYVYSGKKMLVCDLQGVYDTQKKLFRWTDPVVHYHNPSDDPKNCHKRGRHGRTDMGQKGIQNFFKSHQCNPLCDLVCKGFIAIP